MIGPKFFPPEKKKVKAPAPAPQLEKAAAADQQQAAEAADPADPNVPAVATADLSIPDYPSAEFMLGSVDPASGYALAVDLTSVGASIESVRLTSPQFRDLNDESVQARIVGNNPTPDRTFSTAFAVVVTGLLVGGYEVTQSVNEAEVAAAVVAQPEAVARLDTIVVTAKRS